MPWTRFSFPSNRAPGPPARSIPTSLGTNQKCFVALLSSQKHLHDAISASHTCSKWAFIHKSRTDSDDLWQCLDLAEDTHLTISADDVRRKKRDYHHSLLATPAINLFSDHVQWRIYVKFHTLPFNASRGGSRADLTHSSLRSGEATGSVNSYA